MTEELIPCPFSGAIPEVKQVTSTAYTLICKESDIRWLATESPTTPDPKAWLIERWNTRPAPAELDAPDREGKWVGLPNRVWGDPEIALIILIDGELAHQIPSGDFLPMSQLVERGRKWVYLGPLPSQGE